MPLPLLPSLAWVALTLQAPAAPAATAAPSAVAPAVTPSQAGLDELVRAYHDSCEVRLYGEYDDMCSELSTQIRRYRAAMAKASRRPPRT